MYVFWGRGILSANLMIWHGHQKYSESTLCFIKNLFLLIKYRKNISAATRSENKYFDPPLKLNGSSLTNLQIFWCSSTDMANYILSNVKFKLRNRGNMKCLIGNTLWSDCDVTHADQFWRFRPKRPCDFDPSYNCYPLNHNSSNVCLRDSAGR